MENNGWIYLDRKIQGNWIWKNPEHLKAWIDLLMLANYEDKKIPYKGQIITCKRGDVNLSISYLAKRWGWGRVRTRRFLELLEQDGMIRINATTNRTTLSLVKYGFYQNKGTTNRTTSNTTSDTTSNTTSDTTSNTTSDTQLKKYKRNIKEIKEESPESEEEMNEYWESLGKEEDDE